jgi:hypothetical protein
MLFFDNYETVQHLFFHNGLTKFTWQVIYLTFGLRPLVSINYMFVTWVLNMNGGMKKLFLVGIVVMLCTVWLNRKDKKSVLSYMQVIYRASTRPGRDQYFKRGKA